MKKVFLLSLVSLVLISFLFPKNILATLGVGVGTGKIQVKDPLKPGVSYDLPTLTVLNTGDEASEYEVGVEFRQDQEQKKPIAEWFSFSPQKFSLEPGATQVVKIKVNLPIKTEPGDYFAFLESHPTKKTNSGGASVGVAAAAKLYFTVQPANLVQALYYKGVSFWNTYAPWTNIVVGIVLALGVAVIFTRYFKINVNIKKKEEESVNE